MRKCTNYIRDFITGTRNEYVFFKSIFDKNKSGKNFTFKLKELLVFVPFTMLLRFLKC